MTSGKRDRVIISCVTFEVSKIVDPAVYYEATKIHLIHYGMKDVYNEFYNEVCRRLREELPKAEIIEHIAEVFDFKKMMNVVLIIMKQEQKDSNGMADVYVNVSAGTSEYSAAALMASMMVNDIIPFNVTANEYQVSPDKVKDVYYENGRPVGMTKKCKEPVVISTYSIDKPDEKRVLGLSILKKHIDERLPTSAASIIPELAENGLITCTFVKGSKKPDQKTIMNYQRNFVDHWLNDGWIEKKSKRSVAITEDGLMVIEVFKDAYSIGH